MAGEEGHIPVLPAEILAALKLQANRNIIDCTVGAGGHAQAILEQTGPHGRLLGIDQDPAALTLAGERLKPFGGRFHLIEANFDQLGQVVTQPPFSPEHPFGPVHAILADLGVSSMQLDQAERGFSFLKDGPLDMRLGPSTTQSAAELVNHLPEKDLADLIYKYGEERRSRRIARAIVQARPLYTTQALADIVSRAVGGRRGGRIHPATRTFQALRIAVNDELGALERLLQQAITLIVPGGRLAIISFHSLEDRIVKHFFRQMASPQVTLEESPFHRSLHSQQPQAKIKRITKRPIMATDAEKSINPRSRSAKLRVAEII